MSVHETLDDSSAPLWSADTPADDARVRAAPRTTPLAAMALASAGALALEGCGDSGGTTAATTPAPPVTPPAAALTTTQTSRFLSQASIGYAKSDVTALAGSSFSAWLTSQFAVTRPQQFWDYLVANGYNAATNINTTSGFDAMVWSQLMGSADILRQRVGLSLLNMLVVSIDGFNAPWKSFIMADYLDRLWNNAFGNYRDILEAMALSVGMGNYLTYLGAAKANAATGSIPDENFARESMQLFTIGLYQLNADGSQVISAGAPVPTYTQADVSQHARVWTGYTYAGSLTTSPAAIQQGMIVNAATHETGASSFIGISVPAGNTGDTSRKITLDGLFNHANTPPFVSKQLIQHMVTSNPSAAYVGRVSAVFANNGSGVRGDMQAVIRAILMDAEARDDTQVNSTTFGKLREPVVRLTQWARAFNVTSPTNLWPFGNTASSSTRLGEGVGHAPSVFNWFRPGYTVPGGAIATAGMVAPEFQVTNEPSLIAYINYMQTVISAGSGEAKADYSSLMTLATDSQALLNELNLVLAANQISTATIASMKTALDTISTATGTGVLNRIYAAIVLVMAAPEYLVLR